MRTGNGGRAPPACRQPPPRAPQARQSRAALGGPGGTSSTGQGSRTSPAGGLGPHQEEDLALGVPARLTQPQISPLHPPRGASHGVQKEGAALGLCKHFPRYPRATQGPQSSPPPMPPRCAGTPPCPTTKAQTLLPPGTGLGAFAGSNASGGGRAGQRHPQLCSFAVPPRGHHAPSPQGSRTPGGLPVTASPSRRDCGRCPCPCPVPLPGDGPPVTVLMATFPWPHCPP